MNELGKIVFSKMDFLVKKGTLEIELFEVPSGIYFLKVEGEGKRAVMKKLVVFRL